MEVPGRKIRTVINADVWIKSRETGGLSQQGVRAELLAAAAKFKVQSVGNAGAATPR
jgi:hypothetical protein